MHSEYASNLGRFLTHENVTWRESMDGSSFLMATGLTVLAVATAVWWRRRPA
jgi:hypothetical protein